MNSARKILAVLKKYHAKKDENSDWLLIQSAINNSIDNKTPLVLLNFTCSTINPRYMYDQKSPQLYISLDPKGNNLESDLPKLFKLYISLVKYYPVRIVILIGNTDPYYIYTEEGQAISCMSAKELLKKYNRRWVRYKKRLILYIRAGYPKLDIEIISWYELEKSWQKLGWNFNQQFQSTKKDLGKYYSQDELDLELKKLEDAFGKGKYFNGLKKPPISTLKRWVRRKFAEYTVQGLWLKQIFPDAILLQNEKPSDLRTKMYQPLIKKLLNTKLPVLYPYGVDNSGYQ